MIGPPLRRDRNRREDMAPDTEFRIVLSGENVARANMLAADLKHFLEDTSPEVNAEQIRANPEDQDFGTILGIVLGSAAITAVAKGIRDWLARNQDAEIEFRTKDHIFIAKNLRGKDAVQLAKILTDRDLS